MRKLAKEGQTVKAGDVLFVLSSDRSIAASNSAQKSISELLSSRRDSFGVELRHIDAQARHRIAAAGRRMADITKEIQSLADQINLQGQRVAISEQALKRFSDLQATNFISAAQLQEKQAELLDQRQRLADLNRTKSVSQRDLATAQAEMDDLQIQLKRDSAALKRNVSAIEQDLTESEARSEILIRAPQDGVVAAITAVIGQTVSAGQSLLSILPAGADLEAEIYAPSRSAGFVKPGMLVLLRYQAFPYQKFGQYAAHVLEISSTSLRPEDLALSSVTLPASTASEPMYRIRLKLDRQAIQAYGETIPIKSGMVVDASILLEKRRLYEWVLEPLFSISGRI